MADAYELTLALDLRDDLTEAETGELRWHLGLGPQPDGLSIVTEFPFAAENDLGELVVEDAPAPLLAARGEAWKAGGELTADLVRTEKGWALAARQEIHPDDFDRIGELLEWLAAKAAPHLHRPDACVRVGRLRFCAEEDAAPLVVQGGTTAWT